MTIGHDRRYDLRTGQRPGKLPSPGQRPGNLDLAWHRHPERFVHGCPRQARLPAAVWINRPKSNLQTPQANDAREEAPQAHCPGASLETSLTHPRSGYPSTGCVPAEPASVSLSGETPATLDGAAKVITVSTCSRFTLLLKGGTANSTPRERLQRIFWMGAAPSPAHGEP